VKKEIQRIHLRKEAESKKNVQPMPQVMGGIGTQTGRGGGGGNGDGMVLGKMIFTGEKGVQIACFEGVMEVEAGGGAELIQEETAHRKEGTVAERFERGGGFQKRKK